MASAPASATRARRRCPRSWRQIYNPTSSASTAAAPAAGAGGGLEPVRLEAKEALSLMNGTSVMTALGCIAFRQSLRLARLAAGLTAMASDLIRGNQAHFDGRLFAAKPHPGQLACAPWIAEDIASDAPAPRAVARAQDRYSIRCAPPLIGVLLDA